MIVKALRNIVTPDGDSYKVQVAVLDPLNFQVPQRRKRVYIMGVLKMGRTDVVIEWPTPTGKVSLRSIMKHDAKLASYSAYPLPESKILKQRILEAIAKSKEMVKYQPSIKVESVPIIIDGFGRALNWGIDESPTLTKTRCASFGFWSLQHARRLTIKELMRLQGVNPARVNLQGVTKRQLASMLGNAFTVPVMTCLIKAAIEASERH